MKTLTSLLSVLALSASVSIAADDAKPQKPKPTPEEMFKRLDKDGDGKLTIDEYRQHVLPFSTFVFDQLASSHPYARGIHFGLGCDHLLELMQQAGATIIGLDWRTSISDARKRLGADTVIQGNLNPELVLGDVATAIAGTDRVLADNAGNPAHIFNLGHGVQPATNPEVLAAIVHHVHERTAQ